MTTTVVYADASDGYITSQGLEYDNEGPVDGNYADARAGSGPTSALTADTGSTSLTVGQDRVFGLAYSYYVYEAFLSFDTSGIDDGDTVSAAVLNVTSHADSSTTDFTIQARLRDWGTGLTTADFVAGASLSGLTLLATYATSSGFTANTAYDFTDSAMPANVSKTGATRMLLCSSRTVGNNSPTGNELVAIKSADTTGTTSDPKLTVTHAAGGGDNRTGTGSLSVTPSFSRTGVKAGSGTGSLTGGLSFAQAGTKAAQGTGTLALTASFAATGDQRPDRHRHPVAGHVAGGLCGQGRQGHRHPVHHGRAGGLWNRRRAGDRGQGADRCRPGPAAVWRGLRRPSQGERDPCLTLSGSLPRGPTSC
jgi:hypothetical protein